MKASSRAGNRMMVTGFFVPRPLLFPNKTIFLLAKNVFSYALLGIE